MVRTEGVAPSITRIRGEHVGYYTTSGCAAHAAPREIETGPEASLRAGVVICVFYLAAQGATVVVGACNQHETGNRNPRNREGNSDHGVVLSISIMALLRGASAVANRGRFPRWVRPRENGAGRVEVTQLRRARRAG